MKEKSRQPEARFDFFAVVDSHTDRGGSPGDGIAEIQCVDGWEEGDHDGQPEDSESA